MIEEVTITPFTQFILDWGACIIAVIVLILAFMMLAWMIDRGMRGDWGHYH